MPVIRHYISQIYEPEYEISEAEALARGIYIRAFFTDAVAPEPVGPLKPERAEFVRDGQISEVIYYGVSESDDTDVIAKHLEHHSGCEFRCVSRLASTEFGLQRSVRWYDSDGQLGEVLVATLDESGDPVEEVRRTPTGELTSRITYEYDDAGELAWIREYNGSGVMISEDDLRD